MTNVGENILVATETAPVLFQGVFHQYEPKYSSVSPTEDVGRTAPLDGFGTTPASQVPTEIATLKISIPTAIGIGTSN